MRTSRKLTHVLFAVFTLMMLSVAAMAQSVGPGQIYPPASEASDQKAGSMLIYTYYNSDSTGAVNTKINITNTSTTSDVIVHWFFATSGCSVADFKQTLTRNQTASIDVSDVDPVTRGYIMALAEDVDGLPVAHNFLIGDLYYKNGDLKVNLGAIAFSALWGAETAVQKGGSVVFPLPGASASAASVVIAFSGAYGGYNKLARTVAMSSIISGFTHTLVLVAPGGNYLTGAGSGGGSLFGLLFDDQERGLSFSIPLPGCFGENVLSPSYPRTVPRWDAHIGLGTGWMKLYTTDDKGFIGSTWAVGGGYMGGHNLHHLTLTTGSVSATIPVFPFTNQF